MKISYAQISELKRHPMNPKLHTPEQIEHIAESVRRFGFTQPVVIDEANTILVGHARTEAAKLVGMTSVPVVIKAKLKESEKLALLLADNQLAQQTRMDMLKRDNAMRSLAAEGYEHGSLGLTCEFAEPEIADQQKAEEATINQIVIVFEAADFDNLMKKFDALRAKEKLNDNTEVFLRLLDNYEASSR